MVIHEKIILIEIVETLTPLSKYTFDISLFYCRKIYLHSCMRVELLKMALKNNVLLLQRKEYVKYAKVFPFAETLNFKIPSKWYRRTIGALEIICGVAMAFIPTCE